MAHLPLLPNTFLLFSFEVFQSLAAAIIPSADLKRHKCIFGRYEDQTPKVVSLG